MERWRHFAVFAALLLVGFVPALAASQASPVATPYTETPQSGPGIQVNVLADTANVPPAVGDATPEPGMMPLDHRLARITMAPGTAFTGPVLQSAIVYVESGSIAITPAEAPASVNVGDGATIVAANDGSVVCAEGTCDIEPGQTVVLEAGNSLSSVMDSLDVKMVGDEPAVLALSAVLVEGHRPLCWICPTT